MNNRKEISDGTRKMVRLGLASKGAVYSLIGILALMTAFGAGGQTSGKKGAIQWLMEQSYGPYLVALIALGLIFYAIWRIMRGVKSDASDGKGAAKRLGRIGSGIIYGIFAVYAGKLAIGALSGNGSGGSTGGGDKQQQLISSLMESSWGQILIFGFGVIIILRSLYLVYMAYSGKYKEKVESYQIDGKYKSQLIKTGKLGYVARGVVFCIIGYFFIKSVLQHDPSKASIGTGGAMDFIQGTGGTVLMVIIAAGLVCYGIFMFLQARYRNVESLF